MKEISWQNSSGGEQSADFAAYRVALNPRTSITPSAMPRDRMSQHLHSISSGTDGSYHPNNALVLA